MNKSNFYRIKTTWLSENQDNGNLSKRKTEELVFATSYTEAEKVAYSLIESQNRTQFSDDIEIEIIKTKISSILYNDILKKDDNLTCGLVTTYFEEGDETGVGLYGVKVMFIDIDKKGKEKRSHETIYVPAKSNSDASLHVKQHLIDSVREYVVRDAKYDAAEAILWPVEMYSNLTTSTNI